MTFKENLPTGCPPEGCNQEGYDLIYRLCTSDKPTETDFLSGAARNEPLPGGIDLCRWSSCSFFLDLATIQMKRKTFKKLRKYGFAVGLKIADNSGHSLANNRHVDFWMFKNFDPIKAIVQVEAL